MTKPFDNQLAQVRGKIRRINMSNFFERKRSGLLYYFNQADQLHKGAICISENGRHLHDVFAMLAGLSIEILLKGILMGLQEDFPKGHNLVLLCDKAGISIDDNDRIILQAFTEHVVWASKYPAPLKESGMVKALAIFGNNDGSQATLRGITLPRWKSAATTTTASGTFLLDIFFAFRIQYSRALNCPTNCARRQQTGSREGQRALKGAYVSPISGASDGPMKDRPMSRSSTITKARAVRIRTHPGEVLREEYLKPLGVSARALAEAVGVPANRLTEIVRERRSITADTAIRLGKYFETDALFWINLQVAHDLSKAEAATDYSTIPTRAA